MSSVLKTIRQVVADELEALEYFDDIPVLVEDRNDIDFEIDKALGLLTGAANKAGAFVILTTQRCNVGGRTDWGPVFGDILFSAEAYELPALNRSTAGTAKTAWEIAEQICTQLNLWTPDGALKPISLHDPAMESAIIPTDQGPLQLVTVNFHLSAALTGTRSQCAAPVLQMSGENLEMTCGTSGAAIFYTTDGTHPGTTKTLYSGGVTAPAVGTTFKARAWLSGYTASPITTFTIPTP